MKAAQLLDNGFSAWSGGRNVASIPASGTAARNICSEVRAFGRGAPLADDVDTAGPINFTPNAMADNSSVYAIFGGGTAQPQASLSRGGGGRITLGPRAPLQTIQVAYGRSAGSASAPLAANARGRAPATEVAATAPGPRTGAQRPGAVPVDPAPALAGGAAGGAVQRAARAAGQQAQPSPPGAGAIAGAAAFAPGAQRAPGAESPIRLHGAIGGAEAAPLRPSAAAGIRPPARPAAQTQNAAVPPQRAGQAAAQGQKPKPGARQAAEARPKPKAEARTAPKPKPATPKPATPPRRPAAED